jgi:Methyltransferase domain
MFKAMAKRAARIAGLEIAREGPATEPQRWSHTVADYYPIQPRPRWGHGLQPHPYLLATLERGRLTYEDSLSNIEMHGKVLHSIPHTPGEPQVPYWQNTWFSALDAASLVGFILSRAPRHYVEIGSGYSTLFANYARQAGKLGTSITSIDPQPRREINDLCNRLVRKPLEDCDLDMFAHIECGDLLFFDGSHRVFTNSDVTTFFFEVLPRLKPGVLVHIHDVFLPSDYPPSWTDRLYSEQYLLGAMLLCPEIPFKVILPNYFVCSDPALSGHVRRIFQSATEASEDIPFFYDIPDRIPGVSFWFETTDAWRSDLD